MLYADLLLRIGYECVQWNQKSSETENVMFKKWLRKFSSSFNWMERRLEALCLALEAAAGSKSCVLLMNWIRNRTKNQDKDYNDFERWQVDNCVTTNQGKDTRKDTDISSAKPT